MSIFKKIISSLKKATIFCINYILYQNKPPEIRFDADTNDIAIGTKVVLTWKGKRIGKLYLDNLPISKRKNKIEVLPQTTTTYTLKAENPFGSVVLAQTVIVGYPPTIHNFKTDEELPYYVEDDLVDFSFDIRNTKTAVLIFQNKGSIADVNIMNKKKHQRSFRSDTTVWVKTQNKYGTTESRKIELRIAPMIEYKTPVPFPEINLTQMVPSMHLPIAFVIAENDFIAPFPKEILQLSKIQIDF
jgi:hypothetical protein